MWLWISYDTALELTTVNFLQISCNEESETTLLAFCSLLKFIGLFYSLKRPFSHALFFNFMLYVENTSSLSYTGLPNGDSIYFIIRPPLPHCLHLFISVPFSVREVFKYWEAIWCMRDTGFLNSKISLESLNFIFGSTCWQLFLLK